MEHLEEMLASAKEAGYQEGVAEQMLKDAKREASIIEHYRKLGIKYATKEILGMIDSEHNCNKKYCEYAGTTQCYNCSSLSHKSYAISEMIESWASEICGGLFEDEDCDSEG